MISLNLVSNTPGPFGTVSSRLELNDSVNYALQGNPFTRVIAKPSFKKEYERVDETIFLDILGDSYQTVQTNLNTLVQRLERVARLNNGDYNSGLVMEVFISGATLNAANSSFAARIFDYELRLPTESMDYPYTRVLRGVELKITRSPFFDANAYANIPTKNRYNTSISSIPGTFRFDNIETVRYLAAVQFGMRPFSSSIRPTTPEMFVIGTNSPANRVYDLSISGGSSTGPAPIQSSDTTAVGGSFVLMSGVKNDVITLIQGTDGGAANRIYPAEGTSKSALIFGTLACSGTWSVQAGVVLGSTTKSVLSDPLFFEDITNPEVVYLGQIETPGTISGVLTIQAQLYSDVGTLSIDTLTYISNDSNCTQVIKVEPGNTPVNDSAMYFLSPTLGSYGPTSQFVNSDYTDKIVYMNSTGVPIVQTAFKFGQPTDYLIGLGKVGLTYRTCNSFNDSFQSDSMYITVLATDENGGWTMKRASTADYALDGEIIVIPSFPYLPRV